MKVVESERYGWILFSVCFAAFAWRLDLYTVTISLPSISRDFGVGTDTVALVVICYSLLVSSSLLVVGRIEDTLGLKRLLVWGFLIFALGGLGAALAPSIYALILTRSLQGVAGAIIASSIYAMVGELLPEGRRGRAFGLISACAGLGVAAGTPLGGAISGWLSWRGVFLLDVGMGLTGAAVAFKTIPSATQKKESLWSSFDVSGAVLSFLSVFLMLFALNRANRLGWDSPVIIGSLLTSVVLGVLFVSRERRSTSPLVDLRLIGNRRSLCVFLVGVLIFAAMSGNALLMPFYLEMVQGMRPQLAGCVFLIYSLTFALSSPIAGRMAERFPPRVLVTVAMLCGMGACLFFSLMLGVPGNASYFVFLFLFGLSVGLFLPPNNHAVMKRAPEGGKGAYSSAYNMFNNLGWGIGACLFEAVFSRYAFLGHSGAAQSGISRGLLIEGFQQTYLLAAALLLAGLVLSVILLVETLPPPEPAVDRRENTAPSDA